MDHKAFLFNYGAFGTTLAWSIHDALRQKDSAALVDFIAANLAVLKHPDEGQPLSRDWQSNFDTEDVQMMADVALTKFYDPSENFGLGCEWFATEESLRSVGLDAATILLGTVVGPENRLFDPGQMGSYFQSPDLVKANMASLLSVQSTSNDAENITAAFEMIRRAYVARSGLYITF